MEKRKVGIIVTIIATVLCGCPGLFGLLFGGVFALAGAVPGATINNFDGSSDPMTAIATGLGTCCVGLIFVAIPIAVGFFTLRKQAEAPATDAPLS